MKILYLLTVLLNIIAVFVLSIGLFCRFETPKKKANYGYLLTGSLLSYIVFLLIYVLFEIFMNRNIGILLLIICAFSPFIIGKFVKYETLKKYTVIQILCFLVSLFVLL